MRVAAASAENDRADRHALAVLDLADRAPDCCASEWRNGCWDAPLFPSKSGVQSIASPINRVLRRRAILAFPPDIAVVRQRDVGVKRVALDRFHRVRVRFVARPRHDAEIAVLRIDRLQTAVAPICIQAMSSPMVVIFQPAKCAGGISIAKFVLPHALGNAAAT